jgi:matrix metalloproteinase-14 (membrane-inserted)
MTHIFFFSRLNFFSGHHGEGDEPFDGRGGVLAHAFFPKWGGDVHFDAAERWTDRKPSLSQSTVEMKQLLQTAVHEIGHSLGLEHSKAKTAIMAPFYRGWLDSVELDKDDIMGIEAIYGRKKKTTTTSSRPSKRPNRPVQKPARPAQKPVRPVTNPTRPGPSFNDEDVCDENGRFDAVTKTNDGSFYIFRDGHYWKLRLGTSGVFPGYPKPTSDWSGLPGKVDAAFYNARDGMTYLFKGAQGRDSPNS